MRFEFGAFARDEFADAAAFLDRLERFLAALPRGWPYAVEIRNKEFLGTEYFRLLARHNVAHVFTPGRECRRWVNRLPYRRRSRPTSQ